MGSEMAKKNRIILGMRNRVGTSRQLKYTKCANRKKILCNRKRSNHADKRKRRRAHLINLHFQADKN